MPATVVSAVPWRATGVAAVLTIALTACGGAGGQPSASQADPNSTSLPSTGPQSLEEVRDIFGRVDFDATPADEDTDPPDPLETGDVTIETMADFLTFVITETDRFWSAAFAAAGLEEPQVRYNWPTAGESVTTGCKQRGSDAFAVTDDDTALFCPADDTMYVSQQMAYDLWEHGCSAAACDENVAGDFAVAYVVGHEMGHNIEWELNLYALGLPTWRMELLADCMSGLWANRAYYEGLLNAGDVEEAIATADLLGDYYFDDPDHHGTPAERVDAFNVGWNTGELTECSVYLDDSPIE